jgi:hypothetical protein
MRVGTHIAVCLLALAFTKPVLQPPDSSSQVREAFSKIQKLAGKWKGKDEQGQLVESEFVPVASNTAVMETLDMAGMEDMVTLYSVDVNSIALIHYCPTNNQPRMRAVPSSGPVKQLVFAFTGAGNLPDERLGHEQKLVLEFTDVNHITERWTWRRDGKDTDMIFHLVRVRSNSR